MDDPPQSLSNLLSKYISSSKDSLEISVLEQSLQVETEEHIYETLKAIKDGSEHTVLHLAAYNDHSQIVKCLLKYLPPSPTYDLLKMKDAGDRTALFYTVVHKNTETLEAMIDSIADGERYELLSSKDEFEATVTHWAARLNNAAALACILSKLPMGVRYELLQLQTEWGATAINWAGARGHTEVVQCMLTGISPGNRYALLKIGDEKDGRTPIHRAALNGHTETVCAMLSDLSPEYRYDLVMLKENLTNETALELTKLKGNSETRQRMLSMLSQENQRSLSVIQEVQTPIAANYRSLRHIPKTEWQPFEGEVMETDSTDPEAEINAPVEHEDGFMTKDQSLRMKGDQRVVRSQKVQQDPNIITRAEQKTCDVNDANELIDDSLPNDETQSDPPEEPLMGEQCGTEIPGHERYSAKDEYLHKNEVKKLKSQLAERDAEINQLKAQQLQFERENQQKIEEISGLRGELVKMQQNITSLSDTLTQSKVDGGLRPAGIYTGDGEADREHQSGGDIDRHGSLEVKCTKPEQEPDQLEEDEQSAAGKSEDHPPTVDECEIDEAIACSVEGNSSATDKRNPSDLSEVEDSAQVELDYSVFEELEERLGRFCIEHDVEDFLIRQNPVDFTDVVIVGVNASKILKEEFAIVNTEKEQWADFKIFGEEPDDDEDEIELLVNSKIEGKFLAKLNGTCEMLVTASVRSPENNNEIAEFAVGPAHMMFSDETNRQLQNGEGLAQARDFVKLNPPHTKYKVHFGTGDGQSAVIDTHHPPLIGYRYKGPEQDISTLPGPDTADYLNETYVPSEDDREVDCKLCLNDMVLLRLNSEEAKSFHGGLSWHGGRKTQLVNVVVSSDLNKYTRPERSVKIPIEVKCKKGFLVKHNLSIAKLRKRREPYHLRFKLYGGEKLEEGDSGSVVFEVVNNQELRPLGMLTGRVRNVPQKFGSIYQAVILSRAFKDISTECAPDVEHIRPYNCIEEHIEPSAGQPNVD